MAMEVDLALNATRFQAGTKDAERALESLSDVVDDFTRDASDAGEDAADSFDDVRDAAQDAGRDGERAFDDLGDAARDAEREFEDAADAADDLRRELGEAGDAARELGRKADAAGDDARRGMDRASDGVQEFKDEANSTAAEAAASFDGSAESIGDAFQEVAANAFAGFGPAGAVAGIAAAAGIGLAVAGIESAEEAQQAVNDRASEWATAFAESGMSIMSTAQQVAAVQDVYLNQYQELQDNAEEWGVSHQTAALAMVGDDTALAESRASLNARIEESNALNEAYTSSSGDVSLGQAAANQEFVNGDEALTGYEQSAALALEQDQSRNDFLATYGQNLAGVTEATDEYGDTIRTLPDGTTIYIDAETGQATTNVDAIEARIYGVPDGSSTINVATGPVNASSVANYVASRPSVTLAVHAVTSRGERIAI